ncbi:MAG: helix-hairpin-helix domain-containing protein [Bacteroidales bacterium]|jgi:DNA uptake protein ComE-like DNA-binding protein|nr:helix-hairpin-helix domain-containing protein [Bacteroidales bacterium]
MKKLLQKFTDYFAFSKGERRGIVALLGILGCLMIGIQILPHGYVKPIPNYADVGDNPTAESHNYASLQSYSGNHAQQERPQKPPQQSGYRPPREKKPFTVQANICDTFDLQEIRGVGPAFARRIFKYRNLLGGFIHKEQLKEVWGIDSAKYAQIEAAFIIDKQNIRKINLNTATINDLKTHPYLDYYQAKAIVQTRDTQGLYQSIEDILKIALIDQETFDLIREYLEI